MSPQNGDDFCLPYVSERLGIKKHGGLIFLNFLK